MSKYIIGIDFGLKGGLVVLDEGVIVFKEVMPLDATKKFVDVKRVATILNTFKNKGSCHVVVERFGGFFGFGKKIVSSLAEQAGSIKAVVTLLDLPMTAIMPQQWQKVVWEGTKMVNKTVTVVEEDRKVKKQRKDTKKMSLVTANRLYPSENFLATKRSSVAHDGLVDACLLAVYGIRKGL